MEDAMYFPTALENIPLLKILRTPIAGAAKPKLLIYSTDGTITPQMVADEGSFKAALGEKDSGYFRYALRDGHIHLGSEVYHRD